MNISLVHAQKIFKSAHIFILKMDQKCNMKDVARTVKNSEYDHRFCSLI